jgi:hypothetical protein
MKRNISRPYPGSKGPNSKLWSTAPSLSTRPEGTRTLGNCSRASTCLRENPKWETQARLSSRKTQKDFTDLSQKVAVIQRRKYYIFQPHQASKYAIENASNISIESPFRFSSYFTFSRLQSREQIVKCYNKAHV